MPSTLSFSCPRCANAIADAAGDAGLSAWISEWGIPAAAGTVALLSLAALGVTMLHNRAAKPRYFSPFTPKERFNAPFSGGNDLMVDPGPQKQKTPADHGGA
jgi:hypothetical protein